MAKMNEQSQKKEGPKAAPVRSNAVPKELADEGFKLTNPDVLFYKCCDKSVNSNIGVEIDPKDVNVLRGVIMGRKLRAPDPKEPTKVSWYYLVALTAPGILYDHDGNPQQCDRGIIAHLDERYELQRLYRMLPRHADPRDPLSPVVAVTEIVITPLRRVKSSMPSGMWKMRVLDRTIDAAMAGVPILDVGSDDKPADDASFDTDAIEAEGAAATAPGAVK